MSFPDIADTFQPRLPPSGPFVKGGGGGGAGLTHAKFVDPTTDVPLADQTGSDEAPFATIGQAITALGLVGGGAVLLSPGQYPAEVLAPATGIPLTLRGLSYQDAGGCDLSLVSLASKETLAVIDVQTIGNLEYRFNLYLENTTVSGNAVLNGEAHEGNATLINSFVSGQLECDQGIARDSGAGFFFCNTGSCFLTNTNVTTQLTVSGNLVMNGLLLQNTIPSGTTVDTTVTAQGYQIDDLTCFRLQQIDFCQLSGTITSISPELQPIRTSQFIAGVVLAGPAGAIYELDSSSYASFLKAGGTTSGGAVIQVLAEQPRATVSIVVPALAAGEMGFATASLVGTLLEGIQPNTPICVTSTQDLSAAGATRGGMYGGPRISAANTVRVSFNGALAGGASNFIVTRL